jgi:type I restriction enzyme S subunit
VTSKAASVTQTGYDSAQPRIPKGYKQTDAGLIPKDWCVQSMAELYTFQNGVNADKSAYGSGLPFINVLEVITYSTLTENDIPGRVSLSTQTARTFAVQRGDVLFNRTSETQQEVGLASVYDGSSLVVFGGFVIRASPRDGRMIPAFAAHALRSPSVRAQIVARGQGAIRANIGQHDLSRVQVYLPSKPEQEAIASALSDADALVESLEQLLAKKRQLKQGAMQELLTGKKRLPGFEVTPGFKKTEIGEIPNDWNLDRIDNLAQITTGGRNTQDRVDDGLYPFFVRSQIVERINSYSYDGEAVLTAGDGVGTGKVFHYIKGKFDAHQRVYRISEFGPRMNGYFFYLYFSIHFCGRIMQMTAKSSVDSVRREMIAGMLVPLPPTNVEQDAIVSVLSEMDTELAALEAKRAKAQQIKQGMMQKLLTGKIRLA